MRTALLVAALLIVAPAAFAEEWVRFVDQKRSVPARLEWNREIVARRAGVIRCRIESLPAFGVTIIADRTCKALRAGIEADVRSADILFTADSSNSVFERDVDIPAHGSYWFVIENQTRARVEMHLQCSAPARRKAA